MNEGGLLAFRTGALGDFVLTFPALQAFRQRHPGKPLHLVTRGRYGPLAVALGVADTWSDAEARSLLHLPEVWPPDWPAAERILAWLPDPKGPAAHEWLNLLPVGSVEVRSSVFPAFPAFHGNIPAWKFLLAEENPPEPKRVWTPSRLKECGGSPRVVLHVGSGSVRKNYPLTAWEQVIAGLPAHWRKTVVLGEVELGTATEAWAEQLAERVLLEIWRDLPLPQLAERFRSTQLFLGNDSGVGHLAAWLGIPSVILFGPTDAVIWRPWAQAGVGLRALQAPGGDLASLRPAAVLAAVAQVFPDSV